MKHFVTRFLLLLTGLVVVVGLPFAGRWARSDAVCRCAHDGLPIEPCYQVRITDEVGSRRFCCIRCAVRWLEKTGSNPTGVYVTDEGSQDELDATTAHFVQSSVVTNPITRNSIHAFRDHQAALDHSRVFGGRSLTGADRPFGSQARPNSKNTD